MDTKSGEILYAKKIIEEAGLEALIIDVSVKDRCEIKADISADEILNYSGRSWDEITRLGRAERISMITECARTLVRDYHREGRFDAIFSMGGAQNTMVATTAMRGLPTGVPKLMLSTMASGKRTFGPYVDTKDILMMHSVADISGLNLISKNVIRNAVAAVIGMALHGSTALNQSGGEGVSVGLTMLGITAGGVEQAKTLLEKEGFETITFHANGVGGKSMEELIEAGMLGAAMDLTLHEIANEVIGGYCSGADERLEAACGRGIPLVAAPGGVDMIDFSTEAGESGYPEDWKSRQHIYHNASIIHMKVTADEMRKIAKLIKTRLNAAAGPVSFMLPLRGFCEAGAPGGAFHQPEIDGILIEELSSGMNENVKIIKVDANINDGVFAEAAVGEMLGYLAAGK